MAELVRVLGQVDKGHKMSDWATPLSEEDPGGAGERKYHTSAGLHQKPDLPLVNPSPVLEAEEIVSSELEPEVDHSPEEPSWQNVLWREWRYTDDEEYARQLFNLIGDLPASDEIRLVVLGRGLIFGALAGLLFGLIGLLAEVSFWELFWPLGVFIGALLGGTTGAASWWLKHRPTWRQWLGSLTFNLAPRELGLMGLSIAVICLGGLFGWPLGRLGGLGDAAGFLAFGLLLTGSLGISLIGWMIGLSRPPDPDHLHRYRSLWFWWWQRPRRDQLVTALQQAAEVSPEAGRFLGQIQQALASGHQPSGHPEKLVKQLRSHNWLERWTARYLLTTSGGEAVAILGPIAIQKSSSLRPTAIELLRHIERETHERLGYRASKLLCPRCLVRFSCHEVAISDTLKISYYGCRVCRQSQEFLEGPVVALLNQRIRTEVEKIENIRINWLVRRSLFDFDAVRIIEASDEDIERFVVQVGNDTDPFRRPRYKQLQCVINPGCHLSENSRRILAHTFGRVEEGQPG